MQYGLCEAFNSIAVNGPPNDGEDWGFHLSQLETLFPVGTVDPTCEQVIAEVTSIHSHLLVNDFSIIMNEVMI